MFSTMHSGSRVLRPLNQQDIPAALALCRASGWNQVERDWRHFLHLNPSGCRALEHDGILAGTVTTLRYAPQLAWIGMLLVHPSQRGHGIGTMLLEEALRLLEDVPSIWLDATLAGHALYLKLGFEEDAHLARMVCLSPTPQQSNLPAFRLTDEIAALDRGVFGADRATHLQWLAEGCKEGAYSLAGDRAFILSRRGERFFHLGPLIAPDPSIAEQLVRAAIGRLPVIIDVPREPAWLERLRVLGFEEQRAFIRMRKGPAGGKRPHAWEFAIGGPEFG